jgi:hypothetical protein
VVERCARRIPPVGSLLEEGALEEGVASPSGAPAPLNRIAIRRVNLLDDRPCRISGRFPYLFAGVDMTRINRFIPFAFVVVASIWTARPAEAQDKSRPKDRPRNESTAILDSVTIADVERAADQLAIAVQEAVRKATEDPAVKVAALKVAKNAVTAAQVVVTQQAQTLQTILDALARDIAQASEKQQSKSRSH